MVYNISCINQNDYSRYVNVCSSYSDCDEADFAAFMAAKAGGFQTLPSGSQMQPSGSQIQPSGSQLQPSGSQMHGSSSSSNLNNSEDEVAVASTVASSSANSIPSAVSPQALFEVDVPGTLQG